MPEMLILCGFQAFIKGKSPGIQSSGVYLKPYFFIIYKIVRGYHIINGEPGTMTELGKNKFPEWERNI